MSERTVTRRIEAPAEEIWATLADYGQLSLWAPDVAHSCLLRSTREARNEGVGIVRRHQIGRLTVLERVTEWEEPERLAYTIEGLPPVVTSAANEWLLEPLGEASTSVQVTSRIDCGPRPPQELVSRILAARFARTSNAMLDGLARQLARTPTEEVAP